MNVLSHYSKRPGKVFSADFPTSSDNEHKPGGLWLSDDSVFGWYALVSKLVRRGASGWEDGTELLRYRYDFTIDPLQAEQILVLGTPDDLRNFVTTYGEGSLRDCVIDGKSDYGRHINWQRIKSEYKGILITPFQADLSHRKGDPEFHWYRFDCASGCFWDITCLTPVVQRA